MVQTEQKINLKEVREACVDSYAVFAQLMQDDGYFDPIHKRLCDWTQMHIERMEKEVALKGICTGKLAYIMPRGSLKSTIVTKHLSLWLTIRRYYKFKDDTLRVLLAGNTHTNSKKKLSGIRGVFSTVELFKALFPEILPDSDCKWSDESACIKRSSSFDESTYEIGSLNTTLTGRHYNVVIEDDTTAPDADEMMEELTRPSTETIQKAIGFHKAAVPLFVPKGFRLSVVVSTRWAMYDLVSHVRDKEKYYYFDIPGEQPDGTPSFTFAYDAETLSIIKQRIGEYMYSMLYLNKPLDDTLRVFKSTDMQWVDKRDVPSVGTFTIAVDPAISEKDDACESAITVNQHYVDEKQRRFEYWHEDMHGQFIPSVLVKKTLALADKYDTESTPVRAIIIEDVAYQAALRYAFIDEMNRRRASGGKAYPLIPFRSRSNKMVRIEGMQPAFENKRIFFVKGALSDQTESQLLQYPSGKLVDIIDSWSMHRKVWRSERPEQPAADTPLYNPMDFDAVVEAHQRGKRKAKYGLNPTPTINIGQGLDSTGKVYY